MKKVKMNGRVYRCSEMPTEMNEFGTWEYFRDGYWFPIMYSPELKMDLCKRLKSQTNEKA